MISRPWLSAITHVTSCPEREINITTAGACPIIFPTTTNIIKKTQAIYCVTTLYMLTTPSKHYPP